MRASRFVFCVTAVLVSLSLIDVDNMRTFFQVFKAFRDRLEADL